MSVREDLGFFDRMLSGLNCLVVNLEVAIRGRKLDRADLSFDFELVARCLFDLLLDLVCIIDQD